MTTVVVVDDHPVVRDGVRAAMAGTALQLVGEASTAKQGVEMVLAERPDVVLMDLGLPDFSGVEATRQIAEGAPGTAVLAFTMSEDAETVFAALRAGAMGYVLKGVDQADLLNAVQAVAGGEALFLGPGIARRMIGYFKQAPVQPVALDGALTHLTSREREVLDLMAAGWGNHAIATRLHLAPKTVRNHVSNVIGKLHASDRGEAVVRARRLGLGAPEDGRRD